MVKPWFRHLNKKVTKKPFAQARPGMEIPQTEKVISQEMLYGRTFDIMDTSGDGDGDGGGGSNNTTNLDDQLQKQKLKTEKLANRYYAGKAMLDAGALMRNMMQGPPPNIQFDIPHYERMRMDRTPFEQQRTDIERMGQQSYRQLREGVSQTSDLLKGVAAVSAGTQEAMRQVGTQEAQQELAIEQANQQISMQEQQQQSSILNQEAQTNYNIQQQARMVKDQMISNQLARLGDTAGAYAQYKVMKDQADRQEAFSKKQAVLGNNLQLAWLKYEASKSALESDEYTSARSSAVQKSFDTLGQEMLKESKYKDIVNKYGDTYNIMDIDKHAKEYSLEKIKNEQMAAEYENFGGYADQGTMSDDAYKAYKQKYDQAKLDYLNRNAELEKMKELTELEGAFYKDIRGRFDASEIGLNFQDKYLRDRGLLGQAEFMKEVETMMSTAGQLTY